MHDSHAPIAGAKIYCCGHADVAVNTSADGGFDLPPLKGWQVVVCGPDDFPLGCVLVAEAAGHDPGKDWTNTTGDVIYLYRSEDSN